MFLGDVTRSVLGGTPWVCARGTEGSRHARYGQPRISPNLSKRRTAIVLVKHHFNCHNSYLAKSIYENGVGHCGTTCIGLFQVLRTQVNGMGIKAGLLVDMDIRNLVE